MNEVKQKISIITAALACLLCVFMLSGCANDNQNAEADDPTVISPGQSLTIPADAISEVVAFFPAVVDDTYMEIIAFEAADGTLRTALNTCENCHASGNGYYEQDADAVICQQCNMRFALIDIGLQPGGCQPIPISEEDRNIINGAVEITYEVLSENTHWFANWKPE